MMLAALLLACATDADFDGFAAEDDCDDSDPFVYPGAPDDPADGLDADCDGVDPDHGFVGGWTLDYLNATISGYSLLIEGSEEGDLDISSDMLTEMSLAATLNPDITNGAAYPIDLDLLGDASPLAGPAAAAVYLTGEAFGETADLSLSCAAEDADVLLCGGTLQVFGISLSTEAAFTAQ